MVAALVAATVFSWVVVSAVMSVVAKGAGTASTMVVESVVGLVVG